MLEKTPENAIYSKKKIPNHWINEQINWEFSSVAQMTKLKLSDFGHIMERSSSLEKALILEKVEGNMTSSKVGELSYNGDRDIIGRAEESRLETDHHKEILCGHQDLTTT